MVHITRMTVTGNLHFPHYTGSCNTLVLLKMCPIKNSYSEFTTGSFLTIKLNGSCFVFLSPWFVSQDFLIIYLLVNTDMQKHK